MIGNKNTNGYTLFFFKGDDDNAPTIVPVYQILWTKYDYVQAVCYHKFAGEMLCVPIESVIPVDSLEKDDARIIRCVNDWNKKSGKKIGIFCEPSEYPYFDIKMVN